jgi:hypothetical protein
MNEKARGNDPTDRVMKIPPVDSPRHEEALLDQAVAESFPASDPISPAVAERMEPADVQYEKFTDDSARFRERMRRNAPTLIAIGTAAIALLAMRALRGDRREREEYEGRWD